MKKIIIFLILSASLQSSMGKLIPEGSEWKYLNYGSNQGIAWRQSGFDDNSLPEGMAQPEYGDGDETTVLSYGSNANNKNITYYFRKEPYLLYPADNSQMLIIWQTDSTRTCTLKWGTDTTYSIDSVIIPEYGNDHLYQYTISGLDAATKYYYCVTCFDAAPFEGNFVTAPNNNATNLRFFAYGDTRSNPSQHDAIAGQILSKIDENPLNQTFIISSGDLVANGDSENDWQEQFFDNQYVNIRQMMAKLPYIAVVGNHEGQGSLFRKYFPYPMFVTNRFYFSFDYGPAHFTVVDQFTNYSLGSNQYNWIANDLATSNKPWKFLLFHKPGWSADGGHENNRQVQQVIQPLCITYGVQFVITGHNHYYARARVNGVQHITTGGGGAPLYNPKPNYDSIVFVKKSYHYCLIDITKDTLTFSAFDTYGNIIESFITLLTTQNIDWHKTENNFRIASNLSTIRVFNSKQIKGNLDVYDNFGRIIFHHRLTGGTNAVPVNKTGIYFIRISDDKNNIKVVKKVFVR